MTSFNIVLFPSTSEVVGSEWKSALTCSCFQKQNFQKAALSIQEYIKLLTFSLVEILYRVRRNRARHYCISYFSIYVQSFYFFVNSILLRNSYVIFMVKVIVMRLSIELCNGTVLHIALNKLYYNY
jgi:hypothetical protein